MTGWIFGVDPFAGDLRCWCCAVRSSEHTGIWETRRLSWKEPEEPRMTPAIAFVTEDPWRYQDLCPTCRLLPEPELVATARRLARQRLGLVGEDDEEPVRERAETRGEA